MANFANEYSRRFSASYTKVRLFIWKNSFSEPYAGWTFWPEYSRVKAVADAVLGGDHKHALALTRFEPEVEFATSPQHS